MNSKLKELAKLYGIEISEEPGEGCIVIEKEG
jgi:hypothetical protein